MDVVAAVSTLAGCVPSVLDEVSTSACLSDIGRVRGWLDGVEARLAHLRHSPSPGSPDSPATTAVASAEDQLAAAQRSTSRHAQRVRRRGRTLGELPGLADVLDQGDASGEHVDAVAGALSGLPAAQRRQLTETHGAAIAALARRTNPDDLARDVRALGDAIARDAGVSRRTRQRRDTRVWMWTDRHTQMVHLSGRYDPVTGVRIQQRIERATDQLFHHTVPDDCPDDPGQRQDFLRAHALAHLVTGTGTGTGGSGRVGGGGEIIVIVDERTLLDGHEHDHTHLDVPGDIDPSEITVADIRRWTVEPDAVVIPAVLDTDGVVRTLGRPIPTRSAFDRDPDSGGWRWQRDRLTTSLERPQRLDRGRSIRVADHAQRIALRIMHPTCTVPDCTTRYEHTTPHHIAWWERDGGPTDLANLAPLCHPHHHDIHDHGWQITLTADRRPTIRLPNGHTLHGTTPATHHRRLRRTRTARRAGRPPPDPAGPSP